MTIRIEYANFENKIRRLEGSESITLGFKSYIVEGLVEANGIVNVLVGNYSSIAHDVCFCLGINHNMTCVTTYPKALLGNTEIQKKEMCTENNKWNHYQICIGHDVWIGRGVRILGGVKIGNGAVIGAETVVAKDIPPYAVVVGNPAKIIKYRFDEILIRKMQKIKWWYWDEKKIFDNRKLLSNINGFVDTHYQEAMLKKIENQTTKCLESYRNSGRKVVYFIPDFECEYSVWEKVIASYLNKYIIEDPVLLVIELSNVDEIKYKRELELINQWILEKGKTAPLLIENRETENISLSVLQHTDVFVTTRAYTSLVAIDYAVDYGFKIVSGMDADVFDGVFN